MFIDLNEWVLNTRKVGQGKIFNLARDPACGLCVFFRSYQK